MARVPHFVPVLVTIAVLASGNPAIANARGVTVREQGAPRSSDERTAAQVTRLNDSFLRPKRVVVVPRRISSDGSRDVTGALTRFIRSVPNRSAIRFARRGRYRVDGTLEIDGRRNLWLLGNGATIRRVKAGVSGTENALIKRQLRFIGGSNIVIRNLTIIGANPNAGMADAAWDPNYEFQHGIELDGVQGVLIDYVNIHDVYGDFIEIAASHPASGVFIPSRNVTIQNSRFERNGRMGISVDFAEDVLIRNNYMGDCRRSWVDVEPTGTNWEVHGLTIKNNTVGPHRLNFFANAGRGPNVGNVVIADNTTTPGATFGGIVITRGASLLADGGYRGPYLIEGNVGPSRAGFRFNEAADITVQNNDMPFPKDVVARLNDAHTIRIHDNDFTGATAVYLVNDPTPGLSYDYTESANKK